MADDAAIRLDLGSGIRRRNWGTSIMARGKWQTPVLVAVASLAFLETGAAQIDRRGESRHPFTPFEQLFTSAAVEIASGRYRHADRILTDMINRRDFPTLAPARQIEALNLAAMAASRMDDQARAHALTIRATEVAPFNGSAWVLRFSVARLADDLDDALICLIVIARNMPGSLARIDTSQISPVLIETLRQKADLEDAYLLLDALDFVEGGDDTGRIADWVWADFAALLLERDEHERAAAVAGRVSEPHLLVAMRADRRFADIVAAAPERFDVARALEARIARMRVAFERDPTDVRAILDYADALHTAWRTDEALAVVDTALSEIDRGRRYANRYSNRDMLRWLLDLRGAVLETLERHEEAYVARGRAVDISRTDSISHRVNFANHLVRRGEHERALATLPSEGEPASAYGRMQIASIRFRAARAIDDSSTAGEALDYLKAHGNDAPFTLVGALIEAGEVQDAIALFVRHLEHPVMRASALLYVQQFENPFQESDQAIETTAIAEFFRHPSVRSAVERYGHVETYSQRRQGPR
jgi:beta-barrel assembly-enhancing protease